MNRSERFDSRMLAFAKIGAAALVIGSLLVATASSAAAVSAPTFPVMNTSESPPDGVWFRNSPHTSDTSRVTGLGVYANERVQLQCYLFGDPVGPYNDSLWYFVNNMTRPANNGAPNQGYLNAHYINDGQNANVVDSGVSQCGAVPPPAAAPVVSLAQGPAAPAGYRYAISLSQFPTNAAVSVSCRDSVSPGGFLTFTLTTNANGQAVTQSYCYSGDGPDHWVVANGVESNHVAWGASSSGGGGGSAGGGGGTGGGGTGTPPPPPPPSSKTYFAMGDSYSSGEGNPPFDVGTATPKDQCHRSSAAWPRALAKTAGYPIVHAACSGAVVSELTYGRYGETGQISRLAATPNVGLVTITVGGNDIGFSTILGSCRFYPRCLSNLPSNMATIDQIAANLQNTVLPAIRRAAPGARIVLVGYPRLFPSSQSDTINCGWLTDSKRRSLNTLAGYLNAKYLVAASRAGVAFVSTFDSLGGHELCTKNSWINPITSAGTNWYSNANQGHPTGAGQLAMEATVKSALGL